MILSFLTETVTGRYWIWIPFLPQCVIWDTGGVDRYEELDGYDNSALMLSFRKKVEEIKNRATIQHESFKAIEDQKNEWKREMEYLPMISPVNVIYRLGDGMKFREIHPVYLELLNGIMGRISALPTEQRSLQQVREKLLKQDGTAVWQLYSY